jgi:hypothetical protein
MAKDLSPPFEHACKNSSDLGTPEFKFEDGNSNKLELLRSIFCAYSHIQDCDNDSCTAFRGTLETMIPTCNWGAFRRRALQLAACICSRKEARYEWKPSKIRANSINTPSDFDSKYTNELAGNELAVTIELSNVLSILSWLNGITNGRYEVVQELIELQATDANGGAFTDQIMKAIKRAEDLNLCRNRVWAIAGSLPGRELNLPALIPSVLESYKVHDDEDDEDNKGDEEDEEDEGDENDGSDEDDEHDRCTFDFCEESRRDFTSVKQRHECSSGKCEYLLFPQANLEGPALAGKPTAWKLNERSIIEPMQPFMAISHVWADGTGTGPWQAGKVNECLYNFFRQSQNNSNARESGGTQSAFHGIIKKLAMRP